MRRFQLINSAVLPHEQEKVDLEEEICDLVGSLVTWKIRLAYYIRMADYRRIYIAKINIKSIDDCLIELTTDWAHNIGREGRDFGMDEFQHMKIDK